MNERPLRVLSISTSDSSGGAGRAAWRIHHAVRELGIDSTMLVKSKKTEDPDVLALSSLLPKDPLYHFFSWTENKFKNKIQHHRWARYPDRESFYLSDLRSIRLKPILDRMDYDIIHLHWINQRFLSLSQLPTDKPVIWTLHDSWPFCGICHLPLDCRKYYDSCGACPILHSDDPNDLSHSIWKKKKNIYNKLNLRIVAPSKWIANCAASSSLFDKYPIDVIPNCIDSNVFIPGDKRKACQVLGLDAHKKHILFGAMNATKDPNKGFHLLSKALKVLSMAYSNEVDLVIFGSNQEINSQIEGMDVINLGILNKETQIVSAYQAAQVTVVPSLSENLSCTIMESLSCGTPVVAFNIGGNSDLIIHKTNGFLSKQLDYFDLAEGICWCLENNADGQLSGAARQSVLSRFSPKVVAEEYKSLYYSLR